MVRVWSKQKLIDFENQIGDLYMNNQLPFLFHLSGGNEDQLIEIFKEIKEDDYVISSHRNHYHALLHGIPPETVIDRIKNGRSMFIYDRQRNFFVSAIIGGTPAIAAGIAWALKKKQSTQKVWCFVGDGTEDNGHLFEASRYVDGWNLPCKFVIESNDRSCEASNKDRWNEKAHIKWDFKSIIKYQYECTYPHCRKPGMIDLSKTTKKTDDEYFPPLKNIEYPKIQKTGIKYKDAMIKSMDELASEGAIFIGYNVKYGDAIGTLKNVSNDQKIETPVAENLMAGLAIGMSFEGFKPVIYYERHDFMLVAADAIINHIDKIERISHGEFKVPVIIRAVTADAGPFYSGITHSQDFTQVFKKAVSFPVIDAANGDEIISAINYSRESQRPVMLIERKSKY